MKYNNYDDAIKANLKPYSIMLKLFQDKKITEKQWQEYCILVLEDILETWL